MLNRAKKIKKIHILYKNTVHSYFYDISYKKLIMYNYIRANNKWEEPF